MVKRFIVLRCIYTASESYDPDELPVYHVHGCLQKARKSYERLDRSTLVFSVEGYHQITLTHVIGQIWFNLIF